MQVVKPAGNDHWALLTSDNGVILFDEMITGGFYVTLKFQGIVFATYWHEGAKKFFEAWRKMKCEEADDD